MSMLYSFDHIQVIKENTGVYKILLDRPQKKNALHREMIVELISAIEKLASITKPKEMRLLLLEGEGSCFCAGADLNAMQAQKIASCEENYEDALILGNLFYQLASFPTTVMSIVHGAVIGGGFGLACCSDMVFVKEKAVFLTSEVLLGLIPAVISPYVVRKLGVTHASRVMLTGQKIDQDVAMQWGLVNGVFAGSADDISHRIDEEIANQMKAAPQAVRKTKELILKASPLPDEKTRTWTAQQIAQTRVGDEAQSGLQCFFDKSPPPWKVQN